MEAIGTGLVIALGLFLTYLSRHPGGWRWVGMAIGGAGLAGVVVCITWDVAVWAVRRAVADVAIDAVPAAVGAVAFPGWAVPACLAVACLGGLIVALEVSKRLQQAPFAQREVPGKHGNHGERRSDGDQ